MDWAACAGASGTVHNPISRTKKRVVSVMKSMAVMAEKIALRRVAVNRSDGRMLAKRIGDTGLT